MGRPGNEAKEYQTRCQYNFTTLSSIPLPHTGTVLAVVLHVLKEHKIVMKDNSTDIGTVPAAYKTVMNLATNDSDKNVINIIIHKYYYIISVL